MKPERVATLAIVLVVLGAWSFILLKPSQRPDLINSLAGCYQGEGLLSGVEVIISSKGVLYAQGETLSIIIAQDKIGQSFLPDRRITYDPAFPSKLVIDSSSPLLVRISSNRRSFTIPGEIPHIVFTRAACTGTIRPSNLGGSPQVKNHSWHADIGIEEKR